MKELRQRMIEDLQIRNLSESTQETYIRQVAAFASHFGRSPAELGPEHIRSWQVHLVKRGMSWSSLNIAVCALRFLYGTTLGRDWTVKFIPYAKKEKALPVVLSTAEVKSLLDVLTNLKHRAMLMVAYSGGLRVSEIAGLRLEDIDSKRMVIHVRKGKGRKDRFVPLSPKLLDELRVYWRASRPRPFLFPGSDPYRPITPGSIALVCKSATRRAGLKKRVSPHTLRHAFATHHLEAGTDVRTIQMLLCPTSITNVHTLRTVTRSTYVPSETSTVTRCSDACSCTRVKRCTAWGIASWSRRGGGSCSGAGREPFRMRSTTPVPPAPHFAVPQASHLAHAARLALVTPRRRSASFW